MAWDVFGRNEGDYLKTSNLKPAIKWRAEATE